MDFHAQIAQIYSNFHASCNSLIFFFWQFIKISFFFFLNLILQSFKKWALYIKTSTLTDLMGLLKLKVKLCL